MSMNPHWIPCADGWRNARTGAFTRGAPMSMHRAAEDIVRAYVKLAVAFLVEVLMDAKARGADGEDAIDGALGALLERGPVPPTKPRVVFASGGVYTPPASQWDIVPEIVARPESRRKDCTVKLRDPGCAPLPLTLRAMDDE